MRVLITGGAKGIGRATTNLFVERGAHVICADRIEFERKNNNNNNNNMRRVDSIVADLANANECRRVANVALSYGDIDILINNVGIQPPESCVPCHRLNDDWWEKIMNLNVTSYFRMSKEILRSWIEAKRRGGVIVNVSSIQGLQSQAGVPAYAASKGAILSFTRQLAMEYAPMGIRVCSVCPGTVRTPLVDALLEESDRSFDDIHDPRLLNGGVGDPNDVAELICFLASDRAKNITGEYVCTDAGMMAAGAWAT